MAEISAEITAKKRARRKEQAARDREYRKERAANNRVWLLQAEYANEDELRCLDQEALNWLGDRLRSRHNRAMRKHADAISWRRLLKGTRGTAEQVKDACAALDRLPERANRDVRIARRTTLYRALSRTERQLGVADLEGLLNIARELARNRRKRRKVIEVER